MRHVHCRCTPQAIEREALAELAADDQKHRQREVAKAIVAAANGGRLGGDCKLFRRCGKLYQAPRILR